MDKQLFKLLFMLLIAFGSNFVLADDEYRLSAEDVISIKVFGEPDLDLNNYRISSEGEISYPLIGKVQLSGKTTLELEKDISDRLKNGYLKKPRVSVSLVKNRPFFVNGEVKKPGAYPFVNGLTIRKAIAISGGMTDRAAKSKIKLKKEQSEKEFDVADMDIEMGPGDVLTIGESLF